MLVSIIVSVYNEEEGLTSFHNSLFGIIEQMPEYQFEVLWVNDGSTDSSQTKINNFVEYGNNKVGITNISLEFSKNFGHEAAMIAGIDHAKGDCIICLDADLQHPPDRIPDMLKNFSKGNEIVLMCYSERVDSKWKNITSGMFYYITNKISENSFHKGATDFFLISRNVARVLKNNYRNKTRFIRSYIQVIGFKLTTLNFEAPQREFGKSKYPFGKLFQLALNSMFFTTSSLFNIAAYLSFIFMIFGFMLSIYTVYDYLYLGTPNGYATIVLFLSFSFSLVFLVLFIICFYINKLVIETRNEPLYIVKNKDV